MSSDKSGGRQEAILTPIPPMRVILRNKAPRFATARLKVKVHSLALGATGEWRWPEGVNSYAPEARAAMKRWAATRLHSLM